MSRVVRDLCWAALAALAVLWPGRLIGPLDGIPLDGRWEAVLMGVGFPLVWALHPTFLRRASARALVIALVCWKLGSGLVLTQGGWCARILTPTPLFPGGSRVQQCWDVRADWGRPTPRCSAIVARPYYTLPDFPFWFVNLFGGLRKSDLLVGDEGRPPTGTFEMQLEGFLTTDEPGELSVLLGKHMQGRGRVDGAPLELAAGGSSTMRLGPGVHAVDLELSLGGSAWRFVPLWNGAPVWETSLTTVSPPSWLDRACWGLGRFAAAALVGCLFVGWVVSAVRRVRPNPALLAWALGGSLLTAAMGAAWPITAQRLGMLVLFAGLFVPVTQALRNLRGAVLVFGIPWMSLFVARNLERIGQFTFYTSGDDWLNYQQYAHRIFMRGYWLEGGELAFHDQPLYRWIAGSLHLLFGDSSVGEVYWDAACVLIGALFAFHLVKRFGGFRWACAAAAATLATFAVGPAWYLIGRGLSEISATGWAYLAGFAILLGRRNRWPYAALAGAFASLMVFTRLNHLLWALAMSALFLPVGLPAREGRVLRRLRDPRTLKPLLVFLACFAAGLALYAWRTWHYTGVFSVLYGTRRGDLSTGLGPSTLLSGAAWGRALESLLMVLTVQDPPSLEPRGLLVLVGVVCAGLAALRLPGFNRLPLAPSIMCVGAVVFALLVRGYGYPGRFSVHVIPVATALSVCALILVARRLGLGARGR